MNKSVVMVVTFIIRTDLVTLLSLSDSTIPFFTVRQVMYDVTSVITMGTPSPNSTTIRTGSSVPVHAKSNPVI